MCFEQSSDILRQIDFPPTAGEFIAPGRFEKQNTSYTLLAIPAECAVTRIFVRRFRTRSTRELQEFAQAALSAALPTREEPSMIGHLNLCPHQFLRRLCTEKAESNKEKLLCIKERS